MYHFRNPMRTSFLLLSLTLLVPVFSADGPGDWPRWRGPDNDGMARGDAPLRWSDAEHIKWKAEIPGRGHSSPVIWGDRIFITTAVPTALGTAPSGRGGWGGGSRGPQPEQKLILMAPGGIESRETYFAMPGIARMVGDFTSPDFTEADQRRLITNLVYDPGVITDELVTERYRVARTQPKDVLARMRVPDLSPRLGELAQPILGFWGREDGFCPVSGVQKFLNQCADARFVIFNKVGHWVMVERSAEFNRYAIDFLGL